MFLVADDGLRRQRDVLDGIPEGLRTAVPTGNIFNQAGSEFDDIGLELLLLRTSAAALSLFSETARGAS